MKKIECAAALLLLALSNCHSSNSSPSGTILITTPDDSEPGVREITARYHVNPLENTSINNAARRAASLGPSGHIDVDISDGQLVATPDQNSSHLKPSTPTIQTDAPRPVPIVATAAAQKLMKEREVH